MRWIAHRGMAAQRPGGTPTRQTLQTAIDLGVDLVEVDVHATADGVLVIRHDTSVSLRVNIPNLTYAQLKLADPAILTIDEVDSFINGRIRILLDVKGAATAPLLATWLGDRSQPQNYVVCSSRLGDFAQFIAAAPNVDRWPTFPDIDTGGSAALRRVLAALAHRRQAGETRQMLRDVRRALAEMIRERDAGIANLGGMPWRDALPRELADVYAATRPAGISVHQWLVTPDLVDTAHKLGLTVTAWTVNRPDALAAMIRAGVDYVTSDDPGAMRQILPKATQMYPPVLGERPDSPLPPPGGPPTDHDGLAA